MLRNYLLVTLRNMMRNKTVSVVHITGFGLGIAAFLFAVQNLLFEFSFDSFLPERDKVYAVGTVFTYQSGESSPSTSTVAALYHRIKAELPEAAYVARYMQQEYAESYCVMTYTDSNGNQKLYNELNARYVDEDFLKVFEFTLLEGNRDNALADVTSIVITRSMARKYFGEGEALGKVLQVSTGGSEARQTKFTYQVSGVLEDVPANSTLTFDMLLPFRNFEDHRLTDLKNNWIWPGFFTFIKSGSDLSTEQLTAKINELVPIEAHEANQQAAGAV